MKDALRFCFPALALTLSLLIAPASAAPLDGGKAPVKVTADSMSYQPEKNTVQFSGNVEVQRDTFRMWSATLTMYMKDDGKSDEEASGLDAMRGGDLERIVARKNVRFRMDTKSGTADKATWMADEEVLILEGNPVLKDGQNSITGKRIRYFAKENRSEVEGAPGRRVEAVFSDGKVK